MLSFFKLLPEPFLFIEHVWVVGYHMERDIQQVQAIFGLQLGHFFPSVGHLVELEAV